MEQRVSDHDAQGIAEHWARGKTTLHVSATGQAITGAMLAADLIDSRAALAETRRKLDAILKDSPVLVDCHPGVRLPNKYWGQECPICAVQRKLNEAVALLRGIEWSGGGDLRRCPCCGKAGDVSRMIPPKHREGCELEAFLAAQGGSDDKG